MAKLNTIPKTVANSVLVYGPPKTGKTKLVGDLTRSGFKLLYIGLENGHQTLFQLPPELQDLIDVVILPDTRSFPIGIETCLKIIKGGECYVNNTTGKVQAPGVAKLKPEEHTRVCLSELGPDTIVVFDSITQLTNSAISHITKNEPDDYKLTYDDWGNLGKLMDIFLSHVQQAKFNVICISHETEAELEDGKMKIVPVAGTRNFSRNCAKYFGHVVYTEVKGGKHVFSSSTTAINKIVMGSRTDVALEKMSEPSLAPIFKGEVAKSENNGEKAASQLKSLLIKK